jgi:hypothetical protein
MEILIVEWLSLWFSARQACVYGINGQKAILKSYGSSLQELWRPFGTLVEIKNEKNVRIFSKLDSKVVLESSEIDEFPAYAANIPGIYKPKNENFEGLDAIVVLPSKTGKREDNILIAIEAKTSLLENANKNVYKKLPGQYNSTMKNMVDGGWTPGVNAFFYSMSKGELSDKNETEKILSDCPHMRVICGKALQAAMGPTIFWAFKHLRTLGAVYDKEERPKAKTR